MITSRSICLCSRCVVFNNRGVSGEMLLVRLRHVSSSVLSPCALSMFRHARCPGRFASSFPSIVVRFIAPAGTARACLTRVTEHTGTLHWQCCCPAGIKLQQILYFNAEPQKYEKNKTSLSMCCSYTWLNLSLSTRVCSAHKWAWALKAPSVSAVFFFFFVSLYVSRLEQRPILYGQLYQPLPYRDLIQSTNGDSLQAGDAHNQSNVVALNLNQWLICVLLLCCVTFCLGCK